MILDELYAQIASVERPLREHEPPPEINRGYIALLFACGYRQLGNEARANELATAGRALIAPHADEVHAWVLAAFEARLHGTEMPSLHELDRVTRYKVDRFREASQIIGGGEAIDAMGRFAGGPARTGISSADLDAIDRAFDNAQTPEGEEFAEALLEHTLNTDPQSVAPGVIDRVLGRIDHMRHHRCLALARVIAIAAHAAPERVPSLIATLTPLLADRTWDLDEILLVLVRTLASSYRAELSLVLDHTPEAGRSEAAYRLGRIRTGAVAEAADLLRPKEKSLSSEHELLLVTVEKLLARSNPFAGDWVGTVVANTWDNFGTNSHFTFTLIEVVDRVVRAAVANQ